MLNEAKQLLQTQDHGLLSTFSKVQAGFPYGSLIPYLVDPNLTLTCWVSDLALHTHNLHENNKASLTITPNNPTRDKARLCLLIEAVEVTSDVADLKAAYLQKFSLAQQYFEAHDFKPLELKVQSAYYIGGFGRAGWLEWPK